jgi:hypothetical protein
MAALRPLLAKWGVYFQFLPNLAGVERKVHAQKTDRDGAPKPPEVLYELPVSIVWVNTDDREDTFTAEFLAQAIDSSDKGMNKAYTAAAKYGVMKQFLVSTGDDPDAGGGHEQPVPPPAPRQAPTSQPRQQAPQASPASPRPMPPPVTGGPQRVLVVNVEDTGRSTGSGTSILEAKFDMGGTGGYRTATLFGKGDRLKLLDAACLDKRPVLVTFTAKEFRGKTEYQVDTVAPVPDAHESAPDDAHLFPPDDDIPF